MVMVFAWLAFACLVWKLAATVVIVRDLEKRHIRINYWAIRILACVYAWRYRAVVREETGRVPGAFYHFVIPAYLMWVFLALALVLVAS